MVKELLWIILNKNIFRRLRKSGRKKGGCKRIRNLKIDKTKREVEVYKRKLGKNQEELRTISIHERIIALKDEIEMKFIKLGGYLKLVNDRKLYKEKGCETFNEYLAMPELGFQRSTAYAVMGVYEDYIESGLSETLDIKGISYYCLDRIRQFINEPIEKFKEWISKARELSLSDLNAEIRLARGGKEEVYIPEKKGYPVTCPKCGYKFEHII